MGKKFTSTDQVAAYIAGDLIECLECGKRFQFLGSHLSRIHGMHADEYRERWGLPAMTPLAGQAYRDFHRKKLERMQADGTITYDHLPMAAVKASAAEKIKVGVAKSHQAEVIAKLRPGDHHLLPPGSKRADGRDADKAREAQQRRREAAKKKIKG